MLGKTPGHSGALFLGHGKGGSASGNDFMMWLCTQCHFGVSVGSQQFAAEAT